jgi:hypothetical protein
MVEFKIHIQKSFHFNGKNFYHIKNHQINYVLVI